jgi:putative ABC transport system ATP-binding protein
LKKYWGNKNLQEVLFETQNISFQDMIVYKDLIVLKDKTTFITGESGTGKSTLLRLFNATLTPSAGEIFYKGINLLEIDTIKLRQEVLLVSQEVYLFQGNIKDNFMKFYEYRDEEVISEDKMKEFLVLCCISFSLDKDCTSMSGGERQRVYLAIFLSFLPKVIMLDEPTSALDSKNSNDIMENVSNFCKHHSITMIVVSHDKDINNNFAQDNILLERGY